MKLDPAQCHLLTPLRKDSTLSTQVLERFEKVVRACEEVVDCYELLGETDCLLETPEIEVTHSAVALREIKNETALPL